MDIRLDADSVTQERLVLFEHLLDLQVATPGMSIADSVAVTVGAALEVAEHGFPDAGEYLLQPYRLLPDATRPDTLVRLPVHTTLVALRTFQMRAPLDSLTVRIDPAEGADDVAAAGEHGAAVANWYTTDGRHEEAADKRRAVLDELETRADSRAETRERSWDVGMFLVTLGTARADLSDTVPAIEAFGEALEILDAEIGEAPADSATAEWRTYRARRDTVLNIRYRLAELYVVADSLDRAAALHDSVRIAREFRSDELEQIQSWNSLAVVLEEQADTASPAGAEALRARADTLYGRALTLTDSQVGVDRRLRQQIARNRAWLRALTDTARIRADRDMDGIPDERELEECRATEIGARVHREGLRRGCATDQDGDRVPDWRDRCAETRWGALVGHFGCPIDDDRDFFPLPDTSVVPIGPVSGLDSCPNTEDRVFTDHFGCREGPPPVDPVQDSILVPFLFDRWDLTEEASEALERAASNLGPCPVLSLAGHASEEGTDEYNLRLSERRRDTVRDRLEAIFGAGAIRWVALEALGESQPDPSYTEDQRRGLSSAERGQWRSRNRRVVIRYWRRPAGPGTPPAPAFFGLGMPPAAPSLESNCR